MHLATLEDESTHLYVMSQLFRIYLRPYIAITDIRIPWSWVTGAAFNGEFFESLCLEEPVLGSLIRLVYGQYCRNDKDFI